MDRNLSDALISDHQFQPGDIIEIAFTCQICGCSDEEHDLRQSREDVFKHLLDEYVGALLDLGSYRHDNPTENRAWRQRVRADFEKKWKEAKA